jgi:hypothetical protein
MSSSGRKFEKPLLSLDHVTKLFSMSEKFMHVQKTNGRVEYKINAQEIREFFYNYNCENGHENIKLCPSKRETTATNRWELGSKQNVKCNTTHSLIATLYLLYSKCVLTQFTKWPQKRPEFKRFANKPVLLHLPRTKRKHTTKWR